MREAQTNAERNQPLEFWKNLFLGLDAPQIRSRGPTLVAVLPLGQG